MNTPAKLSSFALGLAVVLGAAAGIGHAVGPVGDTGKPAAHAATDPMGSMDHDGTSSGTPSEEHSGHGASAAAEDVPGGLMIAQHGYSLEPLTRVFRAGQPQDLAFVLRGPDGKPITQYAATHEKDLHLIVVRRDLTDFLHVHPSLAADGTWHYPLTLPEPGQYRMFTDFQVAGGPAMTLGADLSAAGDYQPKPLPAASASYEIDGYTVTLEGRLEAGRSSKVTLSVSKDGKPVGDLQPYLAAYGHLVALRDGDLAYLHVHPEGAPGDGRTPAGPGITFYVTAPTTGDYRLFLDFKHGDTVHTAAFTAHAGEPTGPAPAADEHAHHH
ncbi:hypothetical protein CFP65_6034 [Kitasatospora sp. MMS16-BH015]|uniref:hypothetical protein n=1 Tax=Kitasatospora sp. MMS16-BH015 TaxID=2018025 RepID=UPI000CA165E4|nr:hypothetical protein [Kitasatospora sp. MMS16-BH015]AUG80706.1 hypothetical protein CFP65_6034 [Kitasatospora sp. MMS16-BH015]